MWGRCTKAKKNGIEKIDTYETIEETNDIIELMKAIKVQVFDADEKKHPSLWMVLAWRELCSCCQCEDEDLIDYCRRFVGMVEMVESSCGDLKPKDDDALERRKFISMMFMEGVDQEQCGCPSKNLETVYCLGSKDVYPDVIESALQVLILYSEKALKKKKKQTNVLQAGDTCWECGSTEHYKKDCPKCLAKLEKKRKKLVSSAQVKAELEQELARHGVDFEDDGDTSSSSDF